MKHLRKKAGTVLLAAALLAQVLVFSPAASAASAFAGAAPGTVLFRGENAVDRQFVSETAYELAPGVTEYVTYTNEPSGLNQNIDYFCEIDLSNPNTRIMAGYAGMEKILENHDITWRMQTVRDQAMDAQNYFDRSAGYQGYTIVAALNADFYNMATGQPTGLLMIDGTAYNPQNGRYYFAITKDNQAIISSSSDLTNVAYAVGGSVLLVQNSEVKVGQGGRNVTYTAIGIKADGTVVSMVCRGQSYPVSCGYTQYEVAQMMKARGCVTALLLDGSGSSTYVSRHPGETGITTRNSPSDGQDRQVSSSIFIISTAQADHLFDHASLSPANEVYTPNSAVQFSAVGADKSGATAPLPSGLTWSLSDGSFGTIDSSTGAFTSTGKTGEVTVRLSQGGTVVGSTTLTIANPDLITFAEATASMGNGDTGNLGLRVFYQQREVHYKDGDLTWEITPTQYSRKEYVNSTYNYQYKSGSGSIRSEAHANGITTNMQPPQPGRPASGLAAYTAGWLKGFDDTYADEGWVFVSHNFKVVTETTSDQLGKLTVGTVSDNQLTIDPVYAGGNLTVPSHELIPTERMASAITATVKVSSAAVPSVSGTVTLEACKEAKIAADFEYDSSVRIFHGMSSGGTGDFLGQFDENGQYHPFADDNGQAVTKYTADIKAMGYDISCLSYLGRHGDSNPQIATAAIVSRADGYPVRFGEHSIRIDYTIPGSPNKDDGICFGPTEDIDLSQFGNPTQIGIWVYIPKNTPNLWLRIRYRDGSGNTSQLNFTETEIWKPENVARNADDNWHYFEADISNLQTPVTIPAGMAIRAIYSPAPTQTENKAWSSAVGWVKCKTDENGNIILADWNDERLTHFTNGQFNGKNITTGIKDNPTASYTMHNGSVVSIDKLPIPEYLPNYGTDRKATNVPSYSGTLYFDNLTFVYGSTSEDTENPVIESFTVNEQPMAAGMTLTTGALDFSAQYNDDVGVHRTGVSYAALYVDGRAIDCSVNTTSELRTGIKLSNGSHTIKLSVVDGYGNEATQSYTITVNDPNGNAAPVTVTAHEASAVLGQTVTLDFTPRDNTVTAMNVEMAVDKIFAQNFTYTAAEGTSFSSAPVYNNATGLLSFSITGSVDSGPMAQLTLKVPTSATVGSNLSCRVTGTATVGSGTDSFNGTVSLPVSAPYTLTAGDLIKGIDDTMCFTVTHTATGQPASGVGVYQGGTLLGTSDDNGVAALTGLTGSETYLTVFAQDANGSVSASMTVNLNTPMGSADGTPTRVWRNAADSAHSFNVSWLSNPLYAGSDAKLQLAGSADAIADGQLYTGTCARTVFVDNAAANVCGVKVTGLIPGATYYYRVGDGTDGHWSEVMSFTTGYADTGMKALILGDLQERNNTNLAGILEQVGIADYDLTIQTGDLVDNGGSYGYWNGTMAMLENVTTGRLFALGNHEFDGGLDPNTLIYNQDDSTYYCAEYGNVFVATIAYNGFGDDVLARLVRDAQASNATWKLLVTHQPVYYTNAVAGMNAATQQAIYEAAQTAGIDVVLAGHDHSYARTEPMYNGQVDNEQGITYYICGSLGEKSYGITINPDFHFAKTSGDYNAVYLTLSTTDDTLTINTYDYNNGASTLIDTFTKTKRDEAHTAHTYVWDGGSRLTCACGYNIPVASYTGYANYTANGVSGRVYFNAGTLMTGVFPVGEEVLHAGDNGLLHNSETVITAECWKDGYLGCWCKDCNTFYQFSEVRRLGHDYDENHVCTRRVFSLDTFTYSVCGLRGKDIATLDIKLAYTYGFYTGDARKPGVTVTDPATGYELFPQSTYGDYTPYWEDNVNVGRATVRIVGYSDGPYYGETEVHFDIVPGNISTITAETVSSNSALVSWEAPSGAEEYIVYQRVNGAWTRLGIIAETEYTVTGLEPGTYEFMVRPFTCVDGENFYSTKNSSVVTAVIEAGGVTFDQNGTVTYTYGDAGFTNAASLADNTSAAFAYASENTNVASVDAATGAVTIVGAGSTVITATVTVDGEEVSGQYRLTVLPKTVSLTWAGMGTRPYDGLPSTVSATAGGLLDGDTATVTVTGGDAVDAGTHTASAAGLSNPNYALPEASTQDYVIEAASLTITWTATQLTYTGQPQAPTPTVSTGLIGDDTVEFTVPTATEPGTYKVSAVSTNPNYVVTGGAETSFTIALPVLTAAGGEGDQLSCFIENGVIRVTGMAAGQVTVTATAADGSTASATVSPDAPTASITLAGVTYPVNADGLAEKPANVKLAAGATDVSGLDDLGELEEAQQQAVSDAANSTENKLEGAIAAIAKHVEAIVDTAKEQLDLAKEITLELSQKLTVVDYQPSQSYKVDIKPVYTIKQDGQEIASGQISNDQLTAPVEVKLQVPADITLTAGTTFVRHIYGSGQVEYLKPSAITGQVITFTTTGFSTFEVISDNRTAQVTFTSAAGSQTRTYGPDSIGAALPTAEAPAGQQFTGWTIDGSTYTTLTDELLTAISTAGGAVDAEPSFRSVVSVIVPTTYPISVDEAEHGSVTADQTYAAAGATVTLTAAPQEDYELDVLTVRTANGQAVTVTMELAPAGENVYTFTMPSEGVTVSASFIPSLSGPLPFIDVPQSGWVHKAVAYVYARDIMNGTGAATFAPGKDLNRAMMAQVLYNMEKRPDAEEDAAFTDVSAKAWYFDAVNWAKANGIMSGHGDGIFAPKDPITREQVALVLYNYAKYKGYDLTASADLSAYTDGGSTSPWARAAMSWAVGSDLFHGKGAGVLDPKGTATRAEIAQLLMNFCLQFRK